MHNKIYKGYPSIFTDAIFPDCFAIHVQLRIRKYQNKISNGQNIMTSSAYNVRENKVW